MVKVLRCGDLNPGCRFEARGSNEEDVLRAAAEHAKTQHGMSNIPQEVISKARRFIHDEELESDR